MIIRLKNKDTLIVDQFRFKCCIGKNGLKKNKVEGDFSTPKGKFLLENLFSNLFLIFQFAFQLYPFT